MFEENFKVDEGRPSEPWVRRAGGTSFDLLCIAGVAAIVILVLIAARDLVLPLILAALLGTLFVPIVDGLERWHFPRWLGAAIVMALIIALFIGCIAMIVYGIVVEADDIGNAIQDGYNSLKTELSELQVSDDIVNWVNKASESASEKVGGGLISTLFAGISGLATLFIGLFLGIFILYFLLKDMPTIQEWFLSHGKLSREKTTAIIDGTTKSIRQYFVGTTLIALVNAGTILIALFVLDIPLKGVITEVTFVTAFIPSIGGYIGGAFAVLIALGANGLPTAIILLIVEILANTVIQNPVQAVAYGATLDLNPLLVLIVTTLGAIFAGIAGAILAAPLTAIGVKVYKDLNAAGLPEPPPLEEGEQRTSGWRRIFRRERPA